MSAPRLPLPLPTSLPGPIKKKRVLLVDASEAKRELRADTMRRLGMEVDCAADISEARFWWRADLYNLVLINMDSDLSHRDKFCADLRGALPVQQLAFLVGKPEYLANSPVAAEEDAIEIGSDPAIAYAAHADLPSDVAGVLPLRWGIMEASRRISAVRSVSAARSTAMRNRPAPPRDLELRYSRRAELEPTRPSEFQKEEVQ